MLVVTRAGTKKVVAHTITRCAAPAADTPDRPATAGRDKPPATADTGLDRRSGETSLPLQAALLPSLQGGPHLNRLGKAFRSTSDGTCIVSLVGRDGMRPPAMPSEILVFRWLEVSNALAVAVRSTGARSSTLSHRVEEPNPIFEQAYEADRRAVLHGCLPLELVRHAAPMDYVRKMIGASPLVLRRHGER